MPNLTDIGQVVWVFLLLAVRRMDITKLIGGFQNAPKLTAALFIYKTCCFGANERQETNVGVKYTQTNHEHFVVAKGA